MTWTRQERAKARGRSDLQETSKRSPSLGTFPRVQGRCPACGNATLFLGDGGYVTCSLLGCPDPAAASNQLRHASPDP